MAERQVGCVAGALTSRDYHDLLRDAGFTDVRVTLTTAAGPSLHSAIVQAVKPAA